MQKNIFPLFFLLSVLVGACAMVSRDENISHPKEISVPPQPTITLEYKQNYTEIIHLKPGECAPPPVKLAFPVGVEKPSPFDVLPRVVLPSTEWEEKKLLPHILPYEDISQISATSIAYQTILQSERIWFAIGNTRFPENMGVYSYDFQNDKFLIYTTIDKSKAYPLELFVSLDGGLWGYYIAKNNPNEDLYLLSKYDPKLDSFIFVMEPLLAEEDELSKITDIHSDSQGKMWLAVRSKKFNGFIQFDPITEKVLGKFQLQNKFSKFAIASDQTIWFVANDKKLYRFDFLSKQVASYKELYPVTMTNDNMLDDLPTDTLYLDRDGKIWIGDVGWLDFSLEDPVFYKIIRSPVFVNDYVAPQNQYAWQHPSSIYQDSHNKFWFSGPGLVKLDTQNAEWCLLASQSSPLVEDKDGNLWAVFFGRIYKYLSSEK